MNIDTNGIEMGDLVEDTITGFRGIRPDAVRGPRPVSAYHATHPSPYDDACPDCTGMDADPETGREWSRVVALACVLGMVLIVLIVMGYTE